MEKEALRKPERMAQLERRLKASHSFVIALALVSIVGFAGIVSETLFDFSITFYIESAWMLIIGVGLIIEGEPQTLSRISKEGMTPVNFTHLVTVLIGGITVIAGIFSVPPIRVEAAGFLAVKGIVSLIAVVIIIIQTWVLE